MKTCLYTIIALMVIVVSSCGTSRSLSSTVEDDIYYVPGQKPLVVKEVETITGQTIDPREYSEAAEEEKARRNDNRNIVPNRNNNLTQSVGTSELKAQAESRLMQPGDINETIYENTGYWINGYKGNESDLSEIQRIINMYPEGFGYISDGQDIAMNLSFDPDWNVYTDNGRYWWFPSYTNINLYSSLLFGTYPKYIWTVTWNSPMYDSWAFNDQFNLNINLGWNTPGFGWGFGWNNGYYRPWYNGWYNGFYDPWWGGGWYPGGWYPHWHHNHWPNYPGWDNGHYPNWGPPHPGAGQRPGSAGSGVTGIRPGSGNRPGSNTLRPGSSNRPSSNTLRPSSNTRPGSATRPGSLNRPDNNLTRPSGTRPSSVTRPGSTTRPGSVTRPGNTTRPSTTTRPNSNYTRPNTTTTRPNGTYTRPARRPDYSGSTSNRGSSNSYSRPESNYRSNNNGSSGFNSGSSYSPGRSSSGATHSAPPQRSSSGSNNGGSRGGGRR